MERKCIWMIAAVAAAVLCAGPALAMPFMNGSSAPLQRLLDNLEGFQGLDAEADAHELTNWTIDGDDILKIEAEMAGFRDSNTFGIYSPNGMKELFSGADRIGSTLTLDAATLRKELNSDSFGFYLHSPQGWFSNGLEHNSDGQQHMLVYEGMNNSYLVAVEDLLNGGDRDFDDMVVRITRTSNNPAPVPEPGTLLLLGSGLVGLAVARRNRRQ